ncbi:hypothetical protein SADUNF_Sadunf17G0124300 [Salix dunnii]|uniref:Uncharacterized protein n=1 Tax=Salix dunnii TaxID=1413687 RepID=A0A835MKD6_9ROSI|nr:hypothetical protein SADUNF_Sadunf17G0124300 [Salix dunnii]
MSKLFKQNACAYKLHTREKMMERKRRKGPNGEPREEGGRDTSWHCWDLGLEYTRRLHDLHKLAVSVVFYLNMALYLCVAWKLSQQERGRRVEPQLVLLVAITAVVPPPPPVTVPVVFPSSHAHLGFVAHIVRDVFGEGPRGYGFCDNFNNVGNLQATDNIHIQEWRWEMVHFIKC